MHARLNRPSYTWLRRVVVWASFAAIVAYAIGVALHPWPNDGMIYWDVWQRAGMYGVPWLVQQEAYVYSPAFAQAVWPFTHLTWEAFWAGLVILQVFCLVAIAGPVLGALLLFLPWLPLGGWVNPVQGTIADGNVMLILAAAVAYGVRRPVLWPVVILTKITPGIGTLWFAFQRDWRSFGIAIGATALVAAGSFAIAPNLWISWFELLIHSIPTAQSSAALGYEPYLPLTLGQRLPIALLILLFGARKDWPWVVPIASMLALPAIAYGGFCVGLGILLWRDRAWATLRRLGGVPTLAGQRRKAPEVVAELRPDGLG